MDFASFSPRHFRWTLEGPVGVITLDRPERKNPLTFESYQELVDTFHALRDAEDVDVIVLTGSESNFSSGGDVHDIIGPLTEMDMKGLLRFTRMTGALVKSIRGCPQPVIAAVDGVAVGAGAILAMASDLRIGTARSKTAFLFTRVGLAGCDMGACALLPRIIGQGRAAELLFTGRSMDGEEAERWGFFNRLSPPEVAPRRRARAGAEARRRPNFAHMMTKTQLDQEWAMSLETAIESEAQAQAICMQTRDFERAYEAFVNKARPEFEGD